MIRRRLLLSAAAAAVAAVGVAAPVAAKASTAYPYPPPCPVRAAIENINGTLYLVVADPIGGCHYIEVPIPNIAGPGI